MDSGADAIGSRKSLPANLSDNTIVNGTLDYDKGQQIRNIGYPLYNAPNVGRSKIQAVTNGIADESNPYFVSDPSVSEGGESQHIKRGVVSRLSDGSFGSQSRQPPRHHRSGNVTTPDVRSFHSGSDNDGAFNIKSSNFSLSNSIGFGTFDAGDANNPQRRNNESTSNQSGDHGRTADRWQRERQRFVNFASMSPENVTLSSWEPTSPNVRKNFQSQSGLPEIDHQAIHKSAGYPLEQPNSSATREIQSTIRIMEYSQRQQIRQRRQQSIHSYSTSQVSPQMRTEQRYINRAHVVSLESDAWQLDQTQFLPQIGVPLTDNMKQSLEIYNSARREKRSSSFDTSMSMTLLDQKIGDIVDYSQYPNQTLDAEENSADDRSITSITGKQKYMVGHSRSHSTNDTSTLGRRRQRIGGAAASQSKKSSLKSHKDRNTVQKPINASRLHATSSFESTYSAKSTGTRRSSGSKGERSESPSDRNRHVKQYSKAQRRRDRGSSTQSIDSGSHEGVMRVSKEEDNDYNSFDSGSISDDEEENGDASLKRRVRDGNRLRGPNLQRKGKNMSPFANIGKSSAEKAARSTFLPTSYSSDDKMYSTFVCPRCKTRQREFFTVENAAGRLEGPGSYLALYFSVYVTCSLFIFGLEEGWKPLDCIYFAVITLTTAGLGDFVPTSWVNKIICSIFIYFGVACIGLLLGSYIASMLDHRANVDRKDKQIDACPNCARIKTINEAVIARNKAALDAKVKYLSERGTKKGNVLYKSSVNENIITTASHEEENKKAHVGVWDTPYGSASPAISNSSSVNSRLLGSPVTRQILGRQKHTRHASIDVSSKLFNGALPTTYGTSMVKNFSDEMISHRTATSLGHHGRENATSTPNKLRTIASSENLYEGTSESDAESAALSSSTLSSTEAIWDGTKTQLNAAKYVFVTLRLALFNSMIIIAVGCFGFHFIEGFSLVDSWYFTTVLLTTVGYGDIVPVTDAGKLFATIYILVAGTLLLNNMSSISMIPLELRRRRIERAVLTQFGDHLDDAALRELATGPLVQRLRLATNRTDGLDECTREMFSLAMLVRLGKVTEHDIRGTFSCFRHLDVNNEGVLNSKSIIAGMIAKQRQSTAFNLSTNFNQPQLPPPPPPPDDMPRDEVDQKLENAWFGRHGSLHVPVDTPDNSYSEYIFHQDLTKIQTDDEPVGLPLNAR